MFTLISAMSVNGQVMDNLGDKSSAAVKVINSHNSKYEVGSPIYMTLLLFIGFKKNLQCKSEGKRIPNEGL